MKRFILAAIVCAVFGADVQAGLVGRVLGRGKQAASKVVCRGGACR